MIAVKASLLPLIADALFATAAAAVAQVEYVDPSIGGQGFLLEPTHPSVSLPENMVRDLFFPAA